MKTHPDALPLAAITIIEAIARQVATSVASRVAFQEVARLREDVAELRRRRRPAHDDHGTATLEDVERMHILRTLDETNWTLGGPAGRRRPARYEADDAAIVDEEARDYEATACVAAPSGSRASIRFPAWEVLQPLGRDTA